jgi:hypothetical protein
MRVSCTTLESFRLFMQPDQDWMPESELLATIRGEFTPNRQVLIGQAFDKVLETPERYMVKRGYQYDEFSFSHQTMAAALALMDRRGVYQAKAEKRYGRCTVVAKADQIVGANLKEHKATCGTFNFDKYAESYQWRFMVDIFLPALVTYHVFILDDHKNGVIEVKDIQSFNLFPYMGLQRDCVTLLNAFVDYVETKGLVALLEARQQQLQEAF